MNSECCELLEEAVLKSAFRTAVEEEIATVEAIEVAVRYPSAAQRRKELRELRRVLSGKRRSARIAHAAAMVAAVFGLSVGVLMLQPTARATVVNAVTHFFEDHMSISFGKEEPNAEYKLWEHTVTYIPAGYVLTNTEESFLRYTQTYTKGESYFKIDYYNSENGVVAIDTEHTASKFVQIGDLQGYLVKFDDGTYSLHWGSDLFSFTIKGTLGEKEMLKIARGIEIAA